MTVLSLVLLGVGGSSVGRAEPATTQVRVGGADVDLDRSNGVVEVGPSLGEARGANLLQRFSRFDVAAGDLVDFSSDPGTENIIARIDGGARSEIFGDLRADTSLFLLNPSGFLFGPGSVVSVDGSFHVGTASVLLDENGIPLFDANAPIGRANLTSAAPASFGFLDPLPGAEIVLQGASFEVSPPSAGGAISILGGDVRIEGARLEILAPADDPDPFTVPLGEDPIDPLDPSGGSRSLSAPAAAQRIDIASVRSAGRVDLRGRQTHHDALFAELERARSADQVRDLLGVDGTRGDISIEDTSLRTADGGIFLRGADVRISRSEIFVSDGSVFAPINVSMQDQAIVLGPQTALLDIRATGALDVDASTLELTGPRGVGLIAQAGTTRISESLVTLSDVGSTTFFLPASDPQPLIIGRDEVLPSQVLIDTTGRAELGETRFLLGGAISMRTRAREIGVDGGSVFSFGPGGGDVRFEASGRVDLRGLVVSGFAFDPATFEVRGNGVLLDGVSLALFNQEVGGAPLDFRVDAGSGELRVARTSVSTGNLGASGEAGDIELSSDARIVLESGTSLEASVFGAPGPDVERQRIALHAPEIAIRGSRISTSGFPARGLAPNPFSAPAGIIELSGRPTRSGERTPAERIDILDGSTLETRLVGTPLDRRAAGGQINLFAKGTVRLESPGTELSVNATAFVPEPIGGEPPGPFEALVRLLLLLSGADAGTIDIEAGSLLLLDGARITGSAVAGQGGAVSVRTDVLLSDDPNGAAGAISVDSAIGLDGRIDIRTPEVSLDAGVAALSTDFLNVSSLVRPSCEFLAETGERSELVVARQGLAPSPTGFLLAFDAVEARESAATSDLPPVSAGHAGSLAASRLFGAGRLDEADAAFVTDAADARAKKDVVRGADALRGAGQIRIASGRYIESIGPLRESLALARSSRDRAREASAQASLSSALFSLGRRNEAREQVRAAIARVRQAGAPGVAAAILNNAANQFAAMGDLAEARSAYTESAHFAEQAIDRLNEVKALANAARLELDTSNPRAARELAQRALARSVPLPETNEKAYVLIHLGDTLRRSSSEKDGLARAYDAYQDSISISQRGGSERVLSYGYGRLGALYAAQGRTTEALYLTRQASSAAERANAPESAYLWHWQEGNLLWRMGRAEAAVSAYERAVGILEQTRQDSRPLYGDTSRLFAEEIEPVYRDLASALIDGADRLAGTEAEPALLRSARGVVEKMKAAELRDYFRDECVANIEAKSFPLERLSAEAMVIYPIALDDRIELLIHLPGGLARRSVPVGLAELDATAEELRVLVAQAAGGYARPARKLYDWLVRPYADLLAKHSPKTLVFVPSGALQNVPMGALMDGDRYLLESYSIAVTPSMNLVDPQPLDATAAHVLVAGISDAVRVRFGAFEQELEALPSVDRELRAIAELFEGAQVLRGSEVTRDRLGSAVRDVRPNVLHIATHGLFTGDAETSFLALSDGALTMSELAKVIAPTRFREKDPLELLVMSACETASGDARAGLGLAGVAIRSGARSAIGSLWSLDDRAAERLVVGFYSELQKGSGSKAEALRRAQLGLMRDASGDFAHPYFWANLTLINNWL